jgi:SH3-like domain-containing protein
MNRCLFAITALVLVLAAPGLRAAEFRSVGTPAAILYDAPSENAKRLYILNRGYPVEVIVLLKGWAKIRDASGELAWLELRNLSERRTLKVDVPLAQVRESAADTAPVVFEARQNVLLELVEPVGNGWLSVKHSDGQSGYILASQVWGD